MKQLLCLVWGDMIQVFLSRSHGVLDNSQAAITSLATLKASSGLLTRPSLPGTVGTPAACNQTT